MFQSSLTPALIRRFRGEADKADYVDLSNGFIGPNDMTIIAKSMQFYSSGHGGASSVIELNLSYNHICGVNTRGEGTYDSTGFAALVLILSTSRLLKLLVLDQNFLAIPGCALLGELLASQCPMKSLMLRKCKISMEGASEIAKGLKQNKFLQFLELSGNPLCSSGVGHIGRAIVENTKTGGLQTLSLCNTGIDEEAVSTICSFMSHSSCSLVGLVLDENAIKDGGVRLLAQLLTRNKKLAHLSMASNFLGDASMVYLADSLLKNKTISFLGLQWNDITGDGVKVMAKSVLRGTSLRAMALMGNRVDTPSVTWLVEASAATITQQQQSQVDDEGNVMSAGVTTTRTVYIELDVPFNEPRSKADAADDIEAFVYTAELDIDSQTATLTTTDDMTSTQPKDTNGENFDCNVLL